MTLAEQELQTGREAKGLCVCGKSEPEMTGQRAGVRDPWQGEQKRRQVRAGTGEVAAVTGRGQ